MATPNVYFGLEVECNVQNPTFQVGYYHAGKKVSDYWETQQDASIRPPNRVGVWRSVEFVSKPFRLFELDNVIDELKQLVRDNGNTFRNIEINPSCGAHIHFSVKLKRKTHNMYGKAPIYVLEDISKRIKKRVENSMPQDIVFAFSRGYHRQYSVRVRRDSPFTQRNQEYNWTSNKGIEYRSFNLHGVRKWSEMRRMFKIALGEIQDKMLYEFGKNTTFAIPATEITIKIPEMKQRTVKRKVVVPLYGDEYTENDTKKLVVEVS